MNNLRHQIPLKSREIRFMHRFWDERYQEEGVYGKAPNPFWIDQLSQRVPQPGADRILLPCEGEGRNAVWAAKHGWRVDAFDASSVALATCQRWASEAGVSVNTVHCDALDFASPPNHYAVIGFFYAHFTSELRQVVHQRATQWLQPGGLVILEGFNPLQLQRQSGGPKMIEMLYTPQLLGQDFDALFVHQNTTLVAELNEGPYHQGMAELIRFVGEKPVQ